MSEVLYIETHQMLTILCNGAHVQGSWGMDNGLGRHRGLSCLAWESESRGVTLPSLQVLVMGFNSTLLLGLGFHTAFSVGLDPRVSHWTPWRSGDLTLSSLTGLGLALNFQPSLIMLNRYFNKRRPMANGLAAAGSPVFLCALSPLGQLLQDHYGWRGGFLILGGLLLNCCVCAALMRPLVAPQVGGQTEPRGPQRPSQRLLDLSVFRDRGFLIYAVAASIMVLGLFVPPVFVVSYAKDMGVPDTKAAFLLTILGFIDIFARPTAGFITGLKKVRPYSVYLFSFAMFFNGFTDLTGSTASDYGGLVVFCIFFGISYGMVGALQFEVLMAIVGTQKFSSAIGLVLLLEAVAVLIGPPSGGECCWQGRLGRGKAWPP